MRRLPKVSIPLVAAALLLGACGSSNSSTTKTSTAAATTQPASASAAVVKTASGSKYGTILVNGQGMTLYHLSAEQNGKFICTGSACVGIWHPLTVASGTTPTGEVASISTVKRPEGTVQVTYKGEPLYTFTQDHKAGETNGQGFKDVGTWTVVTTGSTSGAATTTTPAPSATSGEGKYGY